MNTRDEFEFYETTGLQGMGAEPPPREHGDGWELYAEERAPIRPALDRAPLMVYRWRRRKSGR